MKITYRQLILLVSASCMPFAQSCKKSYLNPQPLSFFAPQNTLTNAVGMRAALASCEQKMREEWEGDDAPIINEMTFSDVASSGSTDKSGPLENMNIQVTPDNLQNAADNNRLDWHWSQAYLSIRYANTVITHINDAKFASDNEKNAILGTAYFHRAFRYYLLVHQFGDIPYIDKEYSTPKLDFYTTRRDVILQKMKADLEFAQKAVPVQANKGDITRGAVSHLLTKVNLSLGKFDDAIASASDVINGPYHLMTNRFGIDKADTSKNVIWDLHRPENKSLAENAEGILMTIDRDKLDGNYPLGSILMRNFTPYWRLNINTPSGVKGTTDQVGIEIDQATNFGRGVGNCRGTYYSTTSVWTDPNDLRHKKGNWVRMEDLVYNNPALKTAGDPWYGKHIQKYSSGGALLCTDTIRSYFGWPHYKIYVKDVENSTPRGGHTDMYIFRLAETYLLRAEAYYWKGDLASAAADINMVRTRAGAAPLTPAQVNIGSILDERTRELYIEEPRKSELTRIAYIFALTGQPAYNGKTYSMANFSDNNFFFDRITEKNNMYNKGVVTNHGDTYTMSPYHVLWPVSQAAINANSLGHINQNKGYIGFASNIAPLTSIPAMQP